MKADILEGFESLTDVVNKIDDLVEQAHKTKGRKDKKLILTEAQKLADAFQDRCEKGGNHVKQFIDFL